jgi:hypothetical protein
MLHGVPSAGGPRLDARERAGDQEAAVRTADPLELETALRCEDGSPVAGADQRSRPVLALLNEPRHERFSAVARRISVAIVATMLRSTARRRDA